MSKFVWQGNDIEFVKEEPVQKGCGGKAKKDGLGSDNGGAALIPQNLAGMKKKKIVPKNNLSCLNKEKGKMDSLVNKAFNEVLKALPIGTYRKRKDGGVYVKTNAGWSRVKTKPSASAATRAVASGKKVVPGLNRKIKNPEKKQVPDTKNVAQSTKKPSDISGGKEADIKKLKQLHQSGGDYYDKEKLENKIFNDTPDPVKKKSHAFLERARKIRGKSATGYLSTADKKVVYKLEEDAIKLIYGDVHRKIIPTDLHQKLRVHFNND